MTSAENTMTDHERRAAVKRISELLARVAKLDVDPPEPSGEWPDGVLRQLEEFVAQNERAAARARHARAFTRPRFVVADGWGHIFSEARGDTDTRWVFDRHLWRLVMLHILEPASQQWMGALPEELADVEDSLVNANEEALWDCTDWDLSETDEAPSWAAVPLPRSSGSFLDAGPQQ